MWALMLIMQAVVQARTAQFSRVLCSPLQLLGMNHQLHG